MQLSDLEFHLSGEVFYEEAPCFPCEDGRVNGIMFHRQCEKTKGDCTESSIYQVEA